jgi:hypothetical protein
MVLTDGDFSPVKNVNKTPQKHFVNAVNIKTYSLKWIILKKNIWIKWYRSYWNYKLTIFTEAKTLYT